MNACIHDVGWLSTCLERERKRLELMFRSLGLLLDGLCLGCIFFKTYFFFFFCMFASLGPWGHLAGIDHFPFLST